MSGVSKAAFSGKSFLDGVSQKFSNLLEWSLGDRTALASVICLGLSGAHGLMFKWLLADPSRAPYLEPAAAHVADQIETGFIAGWAVLAMICFTVRKAKSLETVMMHTVIQLCTVHTMLAAHGFGLFTTPYAVLFGISGVLLGGLLFGIRPVVYAVVTGVSFQAISIAGSQLGWFPYAPLMRDDLVIDGRLHSSWLLFTGSWVTVFQLSMFVFAIYLVEQWRKREEQLKTAYALLREQKDQLVRAESLAAMGSLVTGAAHELRNPLSSSGALFQMLKEDVEQSGATASQKREALQSIDSCLSGQARAASIAGRLYLLADLLAPEDSSRPLSTILDTMRSEYPGIAVHTEAGVDQTPVNERMTLTVLRNLLDNARAAGGAQEPRLAASLHGHSLRLKVSDTGRGIPEALQAEIFKPFITGEGDSGNVGLGLYVVNELVHRAGGSIGLDSEERRGTTVTVDIPLGSAAGQEELAA